MMMIMKLERNNDKDHTKITQHQLSISAKKTQSKNGL